MLAVQCKMARTALDLGVRDLAKLAGVSPDTVARLERGEALREKTVAAIRAALEAAGVEFIAENGGGAGVRLRLAVPRLEKVSLSSFEGRVVLGIAYRGRPFRVTLPSTVLEDMDRSNFRTDAELKGSFDRHASLVLVRAATAIDSGRAAEDGSLCLEPDDFPEAS